MIKKLESLFTKATVNTSTNVFGLVRSLLAFGTLLTLVFNPTDVLFANTVGFNGPVCVGPTKLSLYCIFNENLETARYLSIVILLVTISGWRPRFTGLFHWWATFSLNSSASILEGGDQVCTVLTFMLIPLCFADSRKWHWDTAVAPSYQTNMIRELSLFFSSTTYIIIKLQVFYIYFNAAVGKFNSPEWMNGTAVYYFFLNPYMGGPDFLLPFLRLMVTNSFTTPLLTWCTVLFEITLAFAIVMPVSVSQHLA